MKKKLSETAIANELREGSVFFRDQLSPLKSNSVNVTKPVDSPIKKQPSATPTPELPESGTTELPKSRSSRLPKSRTHGVRKSRSSRVPNSGTTGVPDFRSYDIPNYNKLNRIDLRVTWDQRYFLDDQELMIRRAMPDIERDNPNHRRLTKNSVVRVLVEIARQLELKIDARKLRNEADLLQAYYDALKRQLR